MFLKNELQTRVNEVISQGLIVHTALDPHKQKEDVTYIDKLLDRTNDLQATSIVINNETREIVSMFGGKDYKKFDFNRANQAVRQPGSALKPLLVYGPVFEMTSLTPNNEISGGNYVL